MKPEPNPPNPTPKGAQMKTQLQLIPPTLNPDGSCPFCLGGWLCNYHQQEGLRKDREKAATLRHVAAHIRQSRIESICAQYELESDEGGTAEEKAMRLLNS